MDLGLRYQDQDGAVNVVSLPLFGGGATACAIGVTVHSSKPRDQEFQLGVPEAMSGLGVTLFETLPRHEGAAAESPDAITGEVSTTPLRLRH
jgi:hypothetical protein